MKILRFTPLITFGACVLAGLWLSQSLFTRSPSITNPKESSLFSPDGGKNLTLIIVDQLGSPTPTLSGIWLLALSKDNPTVDLIPGFPTLDQDKNQAIAQAFGLTPKNQPDTQFIDALRKQHLPLDHYLILDEEAVAQIIDLFGGISINGTIFDGKQIIQGAHMAGKSPEASLSAQITLVDQLCERFAQQNPPPNLHKLIYPLSHHTSTNLDMEFILTKWQMLMAEGKRFQVDASANQTRRLTLTP
jgi:hypothetical protein